MNENAHSYSFLQTNPELITPLHIDRTEYSDIY